jgi:hypothetical protein
VQYVGDLMKLLDVPSMQIAARKLIKTYQLVERTGSKSFESVSLCGCFLVSAAASCGDIDVCVCYRS